MHARVDVAFFLPAFFFYFKRLWGSGRRTLGHLDVLPKQQANKQDFPMSSKCGRGGGGRSLPMLKQAIPPRGSWMVRFSFGCPVGPDSPVPPSR